MYMKQDLKNLGQQFIYLKPVSAAELPEELRQEAGDIEIVFSVHNTEGEQVALVADKRVADALARQNELEVVALH